MSGRPVRNTIFTAFGSGEPGASREERAHALHSSSPGWRIPPAVAHKHRNRNRRRPPLILIRNLLAALFVALSPAASHACPFEDMLNSVGAGGTVNLPPGTHDCDHPIHLTRDLNINGNSGTVIQSEFIIYGGATVNMTGASFHQVYKSNIDTDAQITVRGGAAVWLDDFFADVELTGKKGFILATGGSIYIRALHAPTVIDYRNLSSAPPATTPQIAVRAYYNSYLMLISFTHISAQNIVRVWTPGIPAGVYVTSSTLTMLQAIIGSTGGANTQCLTLNRGSHGTIHGQSAFYSCQLGITYQQSAAVWIDPAVTYSGVTTKTYRYTFPGEQTLQ